jgi:hypothetical protein
MRWGQEADRKRALGVAVGHHVHQALQTTCDRPAQSVFSTAFKQFARMQEVLAKQSLAECGDSPSFAPMASWLARAEAEEGLTMSLILRRVPTINISQEAGTFHK